MMAEGENHPPDDVIFEGIYDGWQVTHVTNHQLRSTAVLGISLGRGMRIRAMGGMEASLETGPEREDGVEKEQDEGMNCKSASVVFSTHGSTCVCVCARVRVGVDYYIIEGSPFVGLSISSFGACRSTKHGRIWLWLGGGLRHFYRKEPLN